MKKMDHHIKFLLKIGYSLVLCMGIGWSFASVATAESIEEQHKAAIRRLIGEVYHKGNMAAFDDVVAENCVLHDNKRTVESVEMAKRQIRMMINRYRDIQITIYDMIAEGDLVAMRSTFQGIFRQNGNKMTIPGISITRFKDGKIVEVWRTFDTANIFRQLGISLPPNS